MRRVGTRGIRGVRGSSLGARNKEKKERERYEMTKNKKCVDVCAALICEGRMWGWDGMGENGESK